MHDTQLQHCKNIYSLQPADDENDDHDQNNQKLRSSLMMRVLYIQQHGFELNLIFEGSSHMVALGSKFRADDEEEGWLG
jgi:hypothetical protein